MMQRRILTGLFAFLLLSSAFGKDKSSKPKPVTGTMPVTAASAKGRELYQKGMDDYEKLYLERCNEDWRAAVKEDPAVAVAWAWIGAWPLPLAVPWAVAWLLPFPFPLP